MPDYEDTQSVGGCLYAILLIGTVACSPIIFEIIVDLFRWFE